MAVGSSNRVVVELPRGLKAKLYAALKQKGMTLREWFVQSAKREISGSPSAASAGAKRGEKR